MNKENRVDNGPMLNAYPDSMGGTLTDIAAFLQKSELKDVFQSFYILPSIFNTDLDRGFSVIDYELNEQLAGDGDLESIRKLGIDLKLDFILNHASVLSGQFQDIVKNGEKSKYKDFFINWNRFWEGYGEMTEEGYIKPKAEYIKDMFFRKSGLPILMVRFPDGKEVPYWNTFYQEVQYRHLKVQELMDVMDIQYSTAVKLTDMVNRSLEKGKKPKEIQYTGFEKYEVAVTELLESNRCYLGQMDLNIKSPLVWEYYQETLQKLSHYGAKIVRLDAFAYAPKEPGERNFLNEPGTWELLEKIQRMADQYGLSLLPEIHASYEEGIYEVLAEKGYMTYDFFLPGLVLDAIEQKSGTVLVAWAQELKEKQIRTVNMLGCHDGIPLLDLKGLIPEERIEQLIHTLIERGGYVKNLHGQKNIYYQINATFYSALGEEDRKLLFARAIQIFMPGKPQVWYLDLFAGKNDYEAVKRAGEGGHKEINRTNLSTEEIENAMKTEIVRKQLELLRFRNTCPAFGFHSELLASVKGQKAKFQWKNEKASAILYLSFDTCGFSIQAEDEKGERIFEMVQE